ncbi:hypothetical protein F5144DRAFT_125584 [Chaetomium tenue]|uniref:Uncharacterized protein n=1 Tax=Chaetomium tenue TaxID=1854479 RepID=A0ACB7PJP4_9PEZI|nr:hypothetical protein F5144DRAFT_125584 [Chaetomium globosum]
MAQRTKEDASVVGPWITFNAPEHDPAWAFKQAMGKYMAPPASERLEQRKDHFRHFMKRFLSKYNDAGAGKVTFDENTTWPQVLEEATQAFDDYTKRGRSWRHPFRSTQRLFGSVACRIEFLIVLLPDGDFTGALCGGLCLIYNAARRKRDIQELIIRTLDSLSEHVQGTKAFLKMYAWDEDVREKTEDLYIAILEAIEALTEWLHQSSRMLLSSVYLSQCQKLTLHPVGESLKALFEQSDYGKKLEEKLSANLQDKGSSFGDCVSRCLHRVVQAVHHNVLTVGKRVEQVSEHLTALRFEALSSLEEQFHGMSKDIECKPSHLSPNRSRGDANQRPPGQIHRLEERQRNFHLQALQTIPHPNTTFLNLYLPPTPLQPALTIPSLLPLLNFPPNPTTTITNTITTTTNPLTQDQTLTLLLGRATLPPQQQSPLHFAAASHQFQTWLRSLSSCVLTIHDMDTTSTSTALVPVTSYFCALLLRGLARLADEGGGGVYPVGFYCRFHGVGGGDGGSEEGFNGPVGMMRFLIVQVVLLLATRRGEGEVDLSYIGVAEAEAFRCGDLDALCLVFDGLVKQIGVGVVVCVVDWVAWFEQEPAFLEGLHTVMLYLNSLVQAVEQSQTGLVFKLLVTNPMTSQFTRDWFPGQEELYLSGSMLMGAQGFGEGDLNVCLNLQ